MKDPAEHLIDDEDDRLAFEIALINKNNSALVTDCSLRMGEIKFDRFFIIEKDANEFVLNGIWYDKLYRTKEKGNKFYG